MAASYTPPLPRNALPHREIIRIALPTKLLKLQSHAARRRDRGLPSAIMISSSKERGSLQSNWEEVTESFDDMGLKEELLRGIYGFGFEKPSAIQQRAIKPAMQFPKRDLVLTGPPGVGKTAAYTISILQHLDTKAGDQVSGISVSLRVNRDSATSGGGPRPDVPSGAGGEGAGDEPGRLHGDQVPRLHRRDQRPGGPGHPRAGLPRHRRHSRPRPRHDHQWKDRSVNTFVFSAIGEKCKD